MKRHANSKPSKEGLAHIRRVAKEAYPSHTIQFCSHGDLGGHRAPRDLTLAFRLIDARGKYHTNVIWVNPTSLKAWTPNTVRNAVVRSNGK